MNKRFLANATLLAFAAATVAVAETPRAERDRAGRVERDDPNERREAMRAWYEGGFPASYKAHLLRAAARERAKYGQEAFGAPADSSFTSGTDTTASLTGNTWTNLGPTGSDYAQNGGTQLNNLPDGGRVTDFVAVPNTTTLYVAMSGGGVWKTADATAAVPSWTPITEAIGSLSVGALAMDPSNSSVLYLGLGDAFDGTGIGLMKSTDAGASWTGFPSNGNVQLLGTSTIINRVVVTATGAVYVATDKGLYSSPNGSEGTFSLVSLNTGHAGVAPYVWDIEQTSNGLVVSLEADAASTTNTDGQVWYSANGGAWTRATGVTKTGGVGRISLATSGATVYAMAAITNSSSSSDLADIFKSTNGGVSFAAQSAAGARYSNTNTESRTVGTVLNGQGWYNHMLVVDPSNPDTFYFGGALLMAKGAKGNRGNTYTQMTNWLAQFSLPYVHADFHAATFATMNGTRYFFVGSDGGVFRSTGAYTSWTPLNGGIISHLAYSVGSSLANRDAVITGLQDNGTRVRKGATSIFNQEIGGDGFGALVNASNASLMLGSLYYDRIQRSTDGGVNFASACSGITECNNSGTAPFITRLVAWAGDSTGNTVYTYSNTKVYRSTNFGSTWTALPAATPVTGLQIRNVGVAASNGSVIGIVTSGGHTFISTNGGSSWTQRDTPNNGLSMSYISFDPADANTVYVASVAPDATKNHLWVSTNLGASWTVLDKPGASGNGLPVGVAINSIQKVGSTLYAGTHLGVYSSTDGGANWSRFGTGMPLVNVQDLYVAPDNSFIRAATFGRGIWQMN